MEQKSHWVFDYIRYSEKKTLKEKSNNDLSKENSEFKDLKEPKKYENRINQYNSVKESPFLLTFDSLKNSLNLKSMNIKGNELEYLTSPQQKNYELLGINKEKTRNLLYKNYLRNKNNNDSFNQLKNNNLSIDPFELNQSKFINKNKKKVCFEDENNDFKNLKSKQNLSKYNF